MGNQCCSAVYQGDAPQTKTLLINQNQFQLCQTFDRNDPQIKQKIYDMEGKNVYKHFGQNRYFIGKWEDGKAKGQGCIYVPKSILYHGQFFNGTPNGKGQMIFLAKQEQYNGGFFNGKANGVGLYKNNLKKFTFQGQWLKSKPSQGILIFQDNVNINKIQIKDFGMRKAQINYKDGRIYQGQIDTDKFIPQGNGKLIFQDESTYTGSWKNGLMSGQGTYQWKDGSKYIGNYIQGKKQGHGVFYYSSGKRYQGNWVNGKQQGLGKIITKTGEVQKQGFWKDGKFERQTQKLNKTQQQYQIQNLN